MNVTLERKAGWWPAAMIACGVAGIGAALMAWYTAPIPSAAAAPGAGEETGKKIHVPMFVDPGLVRPTPRFRFSFDPPAALKELRSSEGLDAVVAGAPEDLDRAIRLMHWTRKQWEPGIPNPYPPIDARIILRDIRRGFTGGFCAQYNYVLAQALQSFGILARYVSLVQHEVIEARPAGEARWICLDPLYDAFYSDETGVPLSVYEIHRRVRDGLSVTASAGNRIPALATHLSAFSSFAVWLKNDHVSSPINFTDLERYKVHFLDASSEGGRVPAGALSTTEPGDLYSD